MPAKGKSRVTDAQRRKIAEGKLAGKRHADIAAETGLALQTIHNQSNDPRTATLAMELKQEHAPALRRTYGKVVERIERDVEAKDHVVSATARNQFTRLLVLGDPPLLRIAPTDDNKGDCTLEELLISYRKVSVAR